MAQGVAFLGTISKAEANYGPGTTAEHCGNCRHFVVLNPQAETGACRKVTGGVKRKDWCKYWAKEGIRAPTVNM